MENFNCDICNCRFDKKFDVIRHIQTEKHLNHFNPEQKDLIKKIIEYLEDDSIEGKDGIRINSAGGTGKTYCVGSVLKYYRNVVGLGPTNASVKILRGKLKSGTTIHKFFGWSQDVDENGNNVSYFNPPNIKKNTIFVFDEISMMSQAMFSLFKHYIYGKFKFILMGDQCQLPAIENKINDCLPQVCPLIVNKNKNLSLFFQFSCKDYSLNNNMRARNVALNKYVHRIRNDVLNNRQVILMKTGHLNFNELKKILYTNWIVICWSNENVDYFNKLIKDKLFPHSSNKGVGDIGDKIVINSFSKYGYSILTEKTKYLMNGDRFTITNVRDDTFILKDLFDEEQETIVSIKVLQLDNDIEVNFITPGTEEKKQLDNFRIKMTKQIKRLPDKTDKDKETRKEYFRELKEIVSKATIQAKLSFSQTCHKSQGASYDTVFVYEGVNHNTKQDGDKLRYTAVSRASNKLAIFGNRR